MVRNKKRQKQKYREILEAGMKILRPNRQGLYICYRNLHNFTDETKKFIVK